MIPYHFTDFRENHDKNAKQIHAGVCGGWNMRLQSMQRLCRQEWWCWLDLPFPAVQAWTNDFLDGMPASNDINWRPWLSENAFARCMMQITMSSPYDLTFDCSYGRMMGCLVVNGSSTISILPPTLNKPSSCRIGVSFSNGELVLISRLTFKLLISFPNRPAWACLISISLGCGIFSVVSVPRRRGWCLNLLTHATIREVRKTFWAHTG